MATKLAHAQAYRFCLDAGIPLIATILPKPAAAAPEIVELVADLDAHDIFGVLVTEMALDAQAQRRSALDPQILAVQRIGKDRLRMKGIDQIDALIIAAAAIERLLELQPFGCSVR